MCGSKSNLLLTKIEGTMLKLCPKCARHGNVVKKLYNAPPKKETKIQIVHKEEPESEEMIVEDYAQRIRNARELKGIKQEDLAKKINEKESVIHKLETGHMKPNIKLAEKIGRFLGIKLIEEVIMQDHRDFETRKSSESLTLGDIITIKRRR